MDVIVVEGFGKECEVSEREVLLSWLTDFFIRRDVPIISVQSERPTGGTITLSIDDVYNIQLIFGPFLSLAKSIAIDRMKRTGETVEMSFSLLLPGFSEPVQVVSDPF